MSPVDNGKNNCPFTVHGGNCTQICSFGVAQGSEMRLCLNGAWGTLVCNTEGQKETGGASTNNFFSTFPVDSWQGIISIVAIALVFVLCVLMIIYAISRHKKKSHADNNAIAMTVLPPYTDQGDFVFPDGNPPPQDDHADPFAADKAEPVPFQPPVNEQAQAQAAAVAAAEKVRQDQIAAYEQAQKSRGSRSEEGKHEAGNVGYGGVSRITVT